MAPLALDPEPPPGALGVHGVFVTGTCCASGALHRYVPQVKRRTASSLTGWRLRAASVCSPRERRLADGAPLSRFGHLPVRARFSTLIPRGGELTSGCAVPTGGGVLSEDERTSLLRRFEGDWRPFWSRVEALDADALRRSPTSSAWPIGIILAHCARWEDWNYDTITNHVGDGSTPSMAGFDQWNQRWAGEDRKVTPEGARRWLGEAHERLRSLIDGLRPE